MNGSADVEDVPRGKSSHSFVIYFAPERVAPSARYVLVPPS